MSKSYHVDANHNNIVVAILTSDKVDSEKRVLPERQNVLS